MSRSLPSSLPQDRPPAFPTARADVVADGAGTAPFRAGIAVRSGQGEAGRHRIGSTAEAAGPWFRARHGHRGKPVDRDPAENGTRHAPTPRKAATTTSADSEPKPESRP
ncbi:hypothetical protein [Streptomyces sp. NPDC093094]|uniref:hypothetical protein n=1 Tax=Streptomyces sp. NPDC093094 TaxID=3366026 RepID=UPI0037F9C9F7